jgi:hypothetical protein
MLRHVTTCHTHTLICTGVTAVFLLYFCLFLQRSFVSVDGDCVLSFLFMKHLFCWCWLASVSPFINTSSF